MTAFASAMWVMFIDQGPTRDVLDRLNAPVLLLSGDADPLIDRARSPVEQRPRLRPGEQFVRAIRVLDHIGRHHGRGLPVGASD